MLLFSLAAPIVFVIPPWFMLALLIISLVLAAITLTLSSRVAPSSAPVRRYLATAVRILGVLVLLLYGIVPLCGLVVCWISRQDFEGEPAWMSAWSLEGILAIVGVITCAICFGRLATCDIADWIDSSGSE